MNKEGQLDFMRREKPKDCGCVILDFDSSRRPFTSETSGSHALRPFLASFFAVPTAFSSL